MYWQMIECPRQRCCCILRALLAKVLMTRSDSDLLLKEGCSSRCQAKAQEYQLSPHLKVALLSLQWCSPWQVMLATMNWIRVCLI